MKRCFCYLLTLVLGSLAVGGLVFALLRTDVLTLTAATPTALFFFAATLGALLTALITALSTASGVGLHIGAALCCAFLALMAGGILCFLRRYVTTRFTCSCGQSC